MQLSNAVFPVLRGLTWSRNKTPSFSTKTQTAINGREVRIPLWTYPRWTFNLTYSFVYDDYTTAGDLQKIAGFFLNRQGVFDDFLYQDPEDCTVTGQAIGTGDGSTTEYQLIRSFGGFAEPVFGVDSTTLKVYLDGIQTSAVTVNNYGLVTFATRNLLTDNQADIETNTTGFSSLNSAILTRDTTEFWHGIASLKSVTPGSVINEGFSTNNISVTSSKEYAASVWIKGSGTVTLGLVEKNSGGTIIGTEEQPITLSSTWTRYEVNKTFGVTGVNAAISVYTDSAQAITFYTDGLQLEQGASATAWTLPSVIAPDIGIDITADFSFYFRCRFTKDEMEFEEFMLALYELKKCEFISLKL